MIKAKEQLKEVRKVHLEQEEAKGVENKQVSLSGINGGNKNVTIK